MGSTPQPTNPAPSRGVTPVGDDDFEREVLGAEVPVLVDFWAVHCPPCHVIAPHVEAVARAHPERLKVVKVDTNEHARWATRLDLRAIPTLVLFRDGEEVDRSVGSLSRAALEAFVGPVL